VPVERDGTFINMDGLVQRFFRIVDPLGEALPDWMVIRDLAKAMGIDYGYLHCEALFKELAGSQAAFTGMTYSTIGNHGQALSVCRG
jgi:formate dehydrogenase major subunit